MKSDIFASQLTDLLQHDSLGSIKRDEIIKGNQTHSVPSVDIKEVLNPETLKDILTQIILVTPLLTRLKNVQRHLHYDMHEIVSLMDNITQECIDTALLANIDILVQSIARDLSHSPLIIISPLSINNEKVLRFLLGVTLKDISIMISLKPLDDLTESFMALEGTEVCYRIKVVDVDPKLAICIEKTQRLENELRKLKGNRTCNENKRCNESYIRSKMVKVKLHFIYFKHHNPIPILLEIIYLRRFRQWPDLKSNTL